jgi:hypothetical protein
MQHVVTSTIRLPRIAVLATCGALLAMPAAASADTTGATLPADPTLVTDSYALISGTLNPGGQATAYWFEWGKTTSYGQGTPITQAGNGSADVPVDYSLDTLRPATTYHYRLIVKPTTGDNVVGADQSFTTAPALAVGYVGRSARVTGAGKALVALKAVGPADATAQGVLKLTGKVGRQLVSYGSANYSLTPGQKKTISVALNKAGRDAVRAAKGKGASVLASAKTSGIKKPVAQTLTLAG